MTIRLFGRQWGRRRALSDEEQRKLEAHVLTMKQRGYSDRVISQSVPLTAAGVRHMWKRLQAQGKA